jgi:hypothetical protein
VCGLRSSVLTNCYPSIRHFPGMLLWEMEEQTDVPSFVKKFSRSVRFPPSHKFSLLERPISRAPGKEQNLQILLFLEGKRDSCNIINCLEHINLLQIQTTLWKSGYAKGSYIRREEGKRRKLRRWMWLMYSLYKNEL